MKEIIGCTCPDKRQASNPRRRAALRFNELCPVCKALITAERIGDNEIAVHPVKKAPVTPLEAFLAPSEAKV